MRATTRRALIAGLGCALMAQAVPAAAQGPASDDAAASPWPRALELAQEWLSRSVQAQVDQARWYADPPAEWPDGRREPAKVIRRGPRSSGAVALTFDDGYNKAACASIARTLRENDAVGTFFVNGNFLRKDPDRWRHILEGMPVGNHTRSHHYLTRRPHPVIRRQIRDNETIHERILGRPMLKVLRPPYGAYGERVGRVATELGYDHVVFWSVDTHDWKKRATPRQVVRRATRASPGSIILMHCARSATAKAMPAIVRHYQGRGIKLAGLDEVLQGAKPVRPGAKPKEYGRS